MLTRETIRFIRQSFCCVQHLETLLVLRASPSTSWSAEDMAKELRTSAEYTRVWLRLLAASGLASAVDRERYTFCADSAGVCAQVELVRAAYQQQQVDVIEAIYGYSRIAEHLA
jgi:hypothetical protein